MKDSLYVQPHTEIEDFIFDENVAGVFDDMIRRSVPGYGSIINMIGILTGEYAQEDTKCYDLGCSLGAGTLAMRRYIQQDNVEIIAVDNSTAMVDRCRQNIVRSNLTVPVETICADVNDIPIENASVVVVNFTLQFIQPEQRGLLINRIYDALCPGGILIVSEKIAFEDPDEQERQTQLHQSFKKLNGYGELEIAEKRAALENVLIPDSLDIHMERLRATGFNEARLWFRCFNFASFIAFK